MAKPPSFQFYYKDWLSDNRLKRCSKRAKGVWIDLIAASCDLDSKGVFRDEMGAFDREEMLDLLTGNRKENSLGFDELVRRQIIKQDDDGVFYVKRIKEDAELSDIRKESGKKGGNPNLTTRYSDNGYVYLIKRLSDGFIKIGSSKNPNVRLSKLQHKHGDCQIIATVQTENMGQLESQYHQRFEDYSDGEWFNLPSNLLEDFLMEISNQNPTPPNANANANAISKELVTKKALPRELVLVIQKEAVRLQQIIENRLGPLMPNEQKTFLGIVRFLSKKARDQATVDVIDRSRFLLLDKIDYCERRSKPMIEVKRLFVSAIKKEFGYKGSSKL